MSLKIMEVKIVYNVFKVSNNHNAVLLRTVIAKSSKKISANYSDSMIESITGLP
jgi:hypothetical protein